MAGKSNSNGGAKAHSEAREGGDGKRFLRSRLWFDNPDNPGMTALYIERYLNFGLTPGELRSGKPIIGIAQTGSDLSPCNRHHLELAKRVRDGILSAGGVPFEFPVHPIQETGKRPTAALDRNLAYLGLVEILYGYPLDRKSTRLNSSHGSISYAVFCLKKKTKEATSKQEVSEKTQPHSIN